MAATEFVILCGALGSGKTTLLERWLARGGAASTAVIVNDAGDINVDGVILSASAGGVPMATLANGCVCCSLTDDLAFTIEELVAARAEAGQAPFVRIVLECSGLSRPGRVLRSLAPLAALRLSVHIVSTYDAFRPIQQDENGTFEDAIAQLTAAHTVVLNKLDLVNEEGRARARDTVMNLNPLAALIDVTDLGERADAAFSPRPPQTEITGNALAIAQAASRLPPPEILLPARGTHARVRLFRASFIDDRQPEAEDFVGWLEDVSGMAGDRLLRTKALLLLQNDDGCVVLQSVGSTFGAPRRLPAPRASSTNSAPVNNAAARDTGAIFITRDLLLEDMCAVRAPFGVQWTQLQNVEDAASRWTSG